MHNIVIIKIKYHITMYNASTCLKKILNNWDLLLTTDLTKNV